MAKAKIGVEFDPVNTKKVDAAFARLQSKAKGVDFGGGVKSLDKLSRPLGKITGQANEFQKSLEASNARVLAFGASVVVINKLSEAFQALVNNTVKVEATFAKIGVILGGTRKELEQFGRGIFEVAKNTGTAFDQVAEGALELARQGLGVSESLARVETALKLVRVAGIDSQQAVAGLTAAIKGFEGAGLTVAQIGDKLAEVDTKFAVSTEDLINGLERASASARVAGVSFDELLAAVTTVQERTQRGGAVIGNAFKTIFARIGRQDTLQALRELGIEVLDSSGNVRDAIPLFRDLAVELDKLGLQSVKAGDIIQKVAGVRQRDILINLVEDLNSSQSKFAQALIVSGNAVGSLDSKNAKLNQTLEALINNLSVSGQQLASVLGEIGFTDAAGDILKTFSGVVNKINEILQGEGVGAKFAQGIVKGVGSVLTGPGLGLVGAIFLKLFIDLAKFGGTSLKSLLGVNSAAQAQSSLQASILQTLLQNENVQREILALEGNKVAQEQLLLKIYNQQAAAMARVQKAAAVVTPGIFKKGFRGGEAGVGKAAGGYIAAEAGDVSRGVGGASPGSSIVSIPNFAFGGGKKGTMIANSSEYHVPNYAGGGDAIFNQNMVRSMGLPSGARKITAAGGYVPNFVRPQISLGKSGITSPQAARQAGYSESQISSRFGAQGMRAKERSKRKFEDVPLGQFAMIIPRQGVNQVVRGAKGTSNEGLNYTVAGFKGMAATRRGVSNDEKLDNGVKKYARETALREAKLISGNRPKPGAIRELANKGASSGLAGAIFETSVSSILGSTDFDANIDPNRRFDYTGKQGLEELFDVPLNAQFVEAKIRNSTEQRTSMFGKMKKQLGRAARGFTPLGDAINREQAAGVPINQIRINQSGKLKNSKNPSGLAVTNTRDEPTGNIPNFAKGGQEGLNQGLDGSITKLFALQLAVGGLTTVIGKTGEEANNFQKTVSLLGESTMTAVNAMLVMSTIGVNPFGASKQFGGLGKGASAVIPALGRLNKFASPLIKLFGVLARFAGPIGLALVAFTSLNSALKTFTGKGILGQFGIGVESASDSLKRLTEASDKLNLEQSKRRQSEISKEIEEERIRQRAGIQRKLDKARDTASGSGSSFFRNIAKRDIPIFEDRLAGVEDNEKIINLQKESEILDERILDLQEKKTQELQKQVKATITAFQADRQIEARLRSVRSGIEDRFDTGDIKSRISIGGIGSDAKRDLTFQAESLELQGKQELAQFDIVKSYTEQLKVEKNLTDLQKDKIDGISKEITAETTLEQIREKFNDLGLTGVLNEEKIFQALLGQRAALIDNEVIATRRLEKEQNLKKAIDEQTQGLTGYVNKNKEELDRLQKEFPATMAQNLESSLNNVFDSVADGAYSSVGEALGAIAVQFGKDLLAEQRKIYIKNISTNLASSGPGKGFLDALNPFKKASGGFISGGGGVIDDVPAMLTGGEYVIKKSAVQKYGVDFLSRLNAGEMSGYNSGGYVQGGDNVRNTRFFDDASGNMFGGAQSDARLARARSMDFFAPGQRGAGSIVGKENLLAFSEQQMTSGSTDRIGSGSINLELQSSRLTAFGRRRMSPARAALQEAQEQARGLAMQSAAEEERVFAENRDAKKARLKQLQANVAGAFLDASVAGISSAMAPKPKTKGLSSVNAFEAESNLRLQEGFSVDLGLSTSPGTFLDLGAGQKINTSLFNRQANGGVSVGGGSMLTSGEFVMSAASSSQLGRGTLDSINQMTYANGGAVGSVGSKSGSGKADVENVNIVINIEKDGSANASAQGGGNQEQAREFSRKVKDVVLNVINEEKRVSGTLFTRNK